MQRHSKEDHGAGWGEFAFELLEGLAEIHFGLFLVALLIVGVVLLCIYGIYACRRVGSGRANAALDPRRRPNKNPGSIAAMDGGIRD